MRYELRTDNQLVLRDGKPFGEDGSFGGTGLSWVMPQTLAGMVRTSIGFGRGDNYFSEESSRKEILNVGIEKLSILVDINGLKTQLFPIPADILFFNSESNDKLKPVSLSFLSLQNNEGTDITNRDWLIPYCDFKGKPSKNIPFQLYKETLNKYIDGNFDSSEKSLWEMGIANPILTQRVHNGIDENSRVTKEGKLFSNKELYLSVKRDREIYPLSIQFDIFNITANERLSDVTYLGAERKTVAVRISDIPFPSFPTQTFSKKRFLKLILVTQGNFGGWCPDWLRPNLESDKIDFINIPGTQYKVRLRSACISGWEGVSGYDYTKKEKIAQKPFKKLVRTGSLYLIEIENPDESEKIAEYFWGTSLCGKDSQEHRDGYGLTIVACADNQVK